MVIIIYRFLIVSTECNRDVQISHIRHAAALVALVTQRFHAIGHRFLRLANVITAGS
jgi:hypothetical protein